MSTLAQSLVTWMPSEGAAIARGLKRRDPELIERLIERYQHRLYRYLLYLTANRETAEDLFQETWIRVLERGAQYNGKTKFEAWLFAIGRHLVIDLARRKSMASLEALAETRDGEERPFEIEDVKVQSPFDSAIARESAERIGAALAGLDMFYREVLVLRFQEDLKLEEIADIVRVPLSTVKSRLYRGLEALRPLMEKQGGHC